jgi:hypothetical protein
MPNPILNSSGSSDRAVKEKGCEMTWLASLLPLVGVILGAAASYIATARMEKFRWDRQSNSRWDAYRLKAYVEYALSVNRLATQHGRIAAARGIKSDFMPIELEGALAQLVRLASNRGAAWESVLLLGDPVTIETGRRWHSTVFRMEPFSSGSDSDPEEWFRIYKCAGECRDKFYESARLDLGVLGEFPHHNPGVN